MSSALRVSDNLPRDVCAYVKRIAAEAIEARGTFVVALSGGSLPNNLLPLLEDESVDFRRWEVVFVDERHVPLTHADSNFLASRALLVKVPAERVQAIRPELGLKECAAEYEARLRDKRLDLVLLGMGEDGHTASLFPGHALLQEAKLLVAPIADSPKPPPARVTMTLPLITSAAHIAFVAGGAAKQDAVAWIFKEHRKDVPSAMVLERRKDTVFFTDAKAIAKI
jgi:6-phosphogluconolactonase